jgi:hypothetical protein
MKTNPTRLATFFALAGAFFCLRAAEPASASLDQHTLDKRINPILKDLALGDAAKEARVRAILEPHFQSLQAWHVAHDAALAALWTQWAGARATAHQDEVKAAGIVQQIDQVYGSFRPAHDALLTALSAVLTPAQVDAVKDSLTKSPGVKRTFDAYLQVIPNLTSTQKEFILGKLQVARERAMDAISDKEKADIFKTQKVQVEAYIDAQGYDWKKSYKDFVAKVKAQTDAAKPAKKD